MDNQVYKIRPIYYNNVQGVVTLHLNLLETNFIKNIYSSKIIEYYYKSLIDLNENIAYYSIIEDTIAGYICFIKSLRTIYIKMIKDYNVLFVINCMAYISTQPKIFCQDIINRLLALGKNCRQRILMENHELNKIKNDFYELRPMVVAPMHRGSGLAHLLIERAEQDLLNKGESKYFLRVNRMNQRAINFYTKVGLQIVETEGPDILRMEKVLL
jgi:GNAT superfamily N-acetyltransferase